MDEKFFIEQLQYHIGADPQTCAQLLKRSKWDLHKATRLYFAGSQLQFRESPYAAKINRFDSSSAAAVPPVAFHPDHGTNISIRAHEVLAELNAIRTKFRASESPSPPLSPSSPSPLVGPSSPSPSSPSSPPSDAPLCAAFELPSAEQAGHALAPQLTGSLVVFKNGLLWGDHGFTAFSDSAHHFILSQLHNGVAPAAWKIPSGTRLALHIVPKTTVDYDCAAAALPSAPFRAPERHMASPPPSAPPCPPDGPSVSLPALRSDDPEAIQVVVILLSGQRLKLFMRPSQTVGDLRGLLGPFVSSPFQITLVHPKVALIDDSQNIIKASLGDSIVRLMSLS